MHEIFRRLVGEVRRCSAVRGGCSQVALRHDSEIGRRETAHGFRIGADGGFTSGDLAHVLADERQLHGRVDARMRSKDLLDERRPGTRHADDEDRAAAFRIGCRQVAFEQVRAETEMSRSTSFSKIPGSKPEACFWIRLPAAKCVNAWSKSSRSSRALPNAKCKGAALCMLVPSRCRAASIRTTSSSEKRKFFKLPSAHQASPLGGIEFERFAVLTFTAGPVAGHAQHIAHGYVGTGLPRFDLH